MYAVPRLDTAVSDGEMQMGKTLAEKVWDSHLVRQGEGAEPDLL